jgi:hypothetical protein
MTGLTSNSYFPTKPDADAVRAHLPHAWTVEQAEDGSMTAIAPYGRRFDLGESVDAVLQAAEIHASTQGLPRPKMVTWVHELVKGGDHWGIRPAVVALFAFDSGPRQRVTFYEGPGRFRTFLCEEPDAAAYIAFRAISDFSRNYGGAQLSESPRFTLSLGAQAILGANWSPE